jgi:hypothetical protein
MHVSDAGETVVKAAEDDGERRRLAREAEVLRRAAHPGIVRLLDVEGETATGTVDRLTLARVTGPRLVDEGARPSAAVASWAAQVATTVADLHDVGWAHGNLRAEHVLFDDEGRPVLCGFSRAERVAWGHTGADDLRLVDEDTLVQLILDHAPDPDSGVRRVVARWDRRRRRGGLRALAEDLSNESRSPIDGLRSRAHGTGGRDRLPRRWKAGLVVAVGLVALVVAIGVLADSVGSTGRAGRGQAGRATRATEQVAVPAYLLESTGDVTPIGAIGRWDCGPARPAVLDPASGQVWIFDGLPEAGGRTTGVLIDRVPGATGLSVATGAGGCDRLTVLRGRKSAVSLSLRVGG